MTDFTQTSDVVVSPYQHSSDSTYGLLDFGSSPMAPVREVTLSSPLNPLLLEEGAGQSSQTLHMDDDKPQPDTELTTTSALSRDLTGSKEPTVGLDGATLTARRRFNVTERGQTVNGTRDNDRIDGRRGRNNRLNGLKGDDRIFTGQRDVAKGGKGNDRLDARKGRGRNRLFGDAGDDQLYGKKRDRLSGGKGDDLLVSRGSRNILQGGRGNDVIRANKGDRVDGGQGDDIIFAGRTRSRLTGGSGEDQFWLVDGQVPRRASRITDFNALEDTLVISELVGLEQFLDLSLVQQGNNTVISFAEQILATLTGVDATTITFDNFVLDEGVPFVTDLFDRTDYVIGGVPEGMTGGDFDGDGDIDLAISYPGWDITTDTYSGNTMSIFFNNGDGTFASAATLTTGVGAYPSAGDLDGDGDIDLLLSNGGDETISVFSNDGLGNFTETSTLLPGVQAFSARPVDVDNDGDLDIITLNTIGLNTRTAINFGNSISVWKNDGTANFTEVAEYTVGDGIADVETGDIDNDGDLDIVTANRGDATFSFLFNDGSGNFTVAGIPTATNLDLVSVALEDLDDDGNLDVVTSDFARDGQVYVSFNANVNRGSLIGSDVYDTPQFPANFSLVDFDLDGDLDIGLTNSVIFTGTGNREGNQYTVFLNDGDGTFDETSGALSTATAAFGSVIEDLDGDGDLDVALISAEDGRLTILENQIRNS